MLRCLICLEEFADGDELKTHLGMATGGYLEPCTYATTDQA